MSTEAPVAAPGAAEVAAARARDRHALRIAVGATAAFAAAEALGWPASFLAPVLAVQLLALLPRCPSAAAGLRILAMIVVALGVALFLVHTLFRFPVPFAAGVAAGLYAGFYLNARGRQPLLALLLLMAMAVVPVIAVAQLEAATAFAFMLLRAGVVALACVWVAHALVPVPADAPAPPRPVPPATDARRCHTLALASTVTVLPVVLAFLIGGLANALVTLVFTVLIVRQQNYEQSVRNAAMLLSGTIAGGAIALGLFVLLGMAPHFEVFVLAMLLIGIGFGRRIAAGGPQAAVQVFVLNTVMILLSAGLAPSADPAGAFLERLAFIALAGAFAVGSMSLLWPLIDRPASSGAGIAGTHY